MWKKVNSCLAASCLCNGGRSHCATVGLGIESANIVGYQNQGLTYDSLNWLCNPFKAVDGRLWTLADLIPSDDFSGSALQFVDGGGATKKFTLPNGDEVYGFFEYWREDEIDAGDLPSGTSAVTGWYLWGEDGKLYLMSDTQIPEGGCYAVTNTDGDDTTIGGAGQVDSEDTEFPLVYDQLNWYGNCTPVDITLADLIPSDDFSGSALQFVDGGGATKKFTLTNGDEVYGFFEYWREDEIDAGDLPSGASAVTGWYLWGEDGKLYLMNSTPILAGDGFAVTNTDGDDTTITVPSAL